MNNRSSVSYNILNNGDNKYSSAVVLKILDKKISNKKKGVTEIADLSRKFNPNFNQYFKEVHNENPDSFKRYNGVFTFMYDSAHKNGNIYIPFQKNISQHSSPIKNK